MYCKPTRKCKEQEPITLKILLGCGIILKIVNTAITRAKEELKIYWTSETEQYVLKSLKRKDNKRDTAILKTIYEL